MVVLFTSASVYMYILLGIGNDQVGIDIVS